MPVPATATATSEVVATGTATPPPFMNGGLLFLWDQSTTPYPDGPSELEPTINLYLARPGVTPNDWYVEPLLTDLRAVAPTYLSPDENKLAFRVLEDTNENGSYFEGDIYRIHIFTLSDGSLVRINNEESLFSLSWLPDSQSLIYPQKTNIALTHLDNLQVEFLTDNPQNPSPDVPYTSIMNLAASPDGSFQALNILLGTGLSDTRWLPASSSLALFDMNQKEVVPIVGETGYHWLVMQWSPDSQTLAFSHDYGQGLFSLDIETQTVTEIGAERNVFYYPAWSPDSHSLAFSGGSKLFIWDRESGVVTELTSSFYMGKPTWSPDGSTIAVGFVEDNWASAGIRLINLADGTQRDLNLNMSPDLAIWSSDGEWLVFHSGQNERTGLYVVNSEVGEPYLILDTTGKVNAPTSFFWLSNILGRP
jgi:Tol biopolymer transport system component